MKLFILLLTILITSTAYSQTFEVKYKGRTLVYDENVLSTWSYYFSLDFIKSEDSLVIIPAQLTKVSVGVFDNDSEPEKGFAYFTLDPANTIYHVTYDEEVLVFVIENNGPNKGKKALWKFFFTYTKRPKYYR